MRANDEHAAGDERERWRETPKEKPNGAVGEDRHDSFRADPSR